MMTSWANFARTGNPGWSKVTPSNRTMHVFDVEESEKNFDEEMVT